jgi:drug/metabolite transporter (DMT)-like permease
VTERQVALLLAAGLAGISVLADYLLKLASQQEQSASSHWFWLGITVYACMGVGWVAVMRQLSFTEIGIVYSVTSVLLLMLVGVVGLKETLHLHEILGAAMAVGSLFLLARFA